MKGKGSEEEISMYTTCLVLISRHCAHELGAMYFLLPVFQSVNEVSTINVLCLYQDSDGYSKQWTLVGTRDITHTCMRSKVTVTTANMKHHHHSQSEH